MKYIKINVNVEHEAIINELKEMTGEKHTARIIKRALMNEYIQCINSQKTNEKQ